MTTAARPAARQRQKGAAPLVRSQRDRRSQIQTRASIGRRRVRAPAGAPPVGAPAALPKAGGQVRWAKGKRSSHKTFDGGPPSDKQVPLRVDIFDPLRALRERTRDSAKLAVMHDAYQRMHRLPAPLCSACDYEFGGGASRRLFCSASARNCRKATGS
jgi:hypothetical protein